MKLSLNVEPNFSLKHTQPETFVQSQWQSDKKSVKFLIFRWILALYFIATSAFSVKMHDRGFLHSFVYMTHWGIFLCAITTTYGAVLTTLYFRDAIKMNVSSKLYQIYWLLSNVSTSLAFLITIYYYGMLYDFNSGKQLKSSI